MQLQQQPGFISTYVARNRLKHGDIICILGHSVVIGANLALKEYLVSSEVIMVDLNTHWLELLIQTQNLNYLKCGCFIFSLELFISIKIDRSYSYGNQKRGRPLAFKSK